MAPATVSDIPMYGGDDVYAEYRFRTDIAPAGDPVDLSAWDFAAQWRHERDSDTKVDFTVDQTNKAGGVIILTLNSASAQSLGADGWMDLEGTDSSGRKRTFLQARCVWTQDVTRA